MSVNTADETEDVVSGFAAMMNQAAEDAGAPADEAPFGWTTDKDGTRRPKKTPGRPRKTPTVEELKEQRAAESGEESARPADRAPGKGKVRRSSAPGEAKETTPQFREGQISRGVNKLYRKAGKIVRVMDPEIGAALIAITRKDLLDSGEPDPDDITVGEAWEELARGNVRIRRFLLKMIAGGAWGQLFMVHAPVLLAVLMKDAIRQHIPFQRLFEAFLTSDEDGEAPAEGTPMEGMTMPDFAQMQDMAAQMAAQFMNGRMQPPGPRPPAVPGAITAAPGASGS